VFASLFQADRWGVAVFDDQGRLVMANARFCALVGMASTAIVGVACAQLEPESSQGLCAALQEALVVGAPVVARRLALLSQGGDVVEVEAEIRAVASEAASARAVLIVQPGGASVPQSLSQTVK